MHNSLSQFFRDDTGNLSATRLAFLLWAIGSLVLWIMISLAKGSLQPLDTSIVTVLGITMAGKVVQKFGEPSDGK